MGSPGTGAGDRDLRWELDGDEERDRKESCVFALEIMRDTKILLYGWEYSVSGLSRFRRTISEERVRRDVGRLEV